MAQVYSFVDENGATRLFAEIHPDPAGTPFNGGTITTPLVIDVTGVGGTPLTIIGAAASGAELLRVEDVAGNEVFSLDAHGAVIAGGTNPPGNNVAFIQGASGQSVAIMDVETAAGHVAIQAGGATTATLGLFDHALAGQPTLTSGTATPEQIALALQSYGAAGGS